MKPINEKNKTMWGISMMGLLGVAYWLFRFSFFEMHGMKQWTNLLAMLSIAIIVIATILGNRKIPVATVAGYMSGFTLAMIFNTDGIDPGGGRINNAWIIWGAVWFFSILMGLIWSFIFKQRQAK